MYMVYVKLFYKIYHRTVFKSSDLQASTIPIKAVYHLDRVLFCCSVLLFRQNRKKKFVLSSFYPLKTKNHLKTLAF